MGDESIRAGGGRAHDEFQHLTLLHRVTAISGEFGLALETSVYRSAVTGLCLIEQVQQGRAGTSRDTIALGPATVAALLPVLRLIAEEGRCR